MLKWLIALSIIIALSYGGWWYYNNPTSENVVDKVIEQVEPTGTE
jgi:predicted negative regulator of RcsB-dependent stress response|tara:strand:- start:203 stop:337 length:135 start_codon:yes stop_codon:yes gene_type:complete